MADSMSRSSGLPVEHAVFMFCVSPPRGQRPGRPWALGLSTTARAQTNHPSRPIGLLVAFGAGGGTDVLARALAEAASKHLGQTITAIDKPGASGSIGMTEVAHAAPDGHEPSMLTLASTILPQIGIGKVSLEDFAPIARLNFDLPAITVRADAPWATVEEFLDAARKRPGELEVGNAGPGSIGHVAAVALESRTGTYLNQIPFQGAGPAVLALARGHGLPWR